MPRHIRNIDPFHSGISNALKPYNRNRARSKANKSKKLKDYIEYKHQEAIVKVTLKSKRKPVGKITALN